MIVVECHRLTKRFGGIEAIKEVNLRVEEGERRAIIGPNGAGKTTLFRLISGEFPPTSGKVQLFGRDITGLTAFQRAYLGLGRTFQITNICLTQTVLDNLLIAEMGLRRLKFSMFKPLNLYRQLYDRAEEMIEKMELAERASTVVKYLSHGEQRQVEIAMALISNPKVLLLDEPTAGLSQVETKKITNIIKCLDPKITILIIEHDMDVAFELADSITVLNSGQIYAEGIPRDIRDNIGVQEIYLGSD
ncbi:MAG: ABC transporter ATP-binding protein [Pseudomonadota bacterium]